MLKSPPLVATLSDSKRMSPCSWGDIFTWPLRGDRIIGLRQFTAKRLTISVRRAILSCVCQVPTTTRPPASAHSPRSSFCAFDSSHSFSNGYALFCATANTHLLPLQSFPHSFHRDGVYPRPTSPLHNSGPT